MRSRRDNLRKGPGIFSGLSCLCLVLGALMASPVLAQQAGGAPATAQGRAIVPVLTLDWEQLFEETLWGKRIRSDLSEASRALNAENNRIADDLIAEEKALTDRRPTMDPKVFRTEADAFDERATAIRNAQKAKAQALSQNFETARQEFFSAVAPLLDDMLASRGAVVVLDRRVIIRGLAEADVTAELVKLVDARLNAGPADDGIPSPAVEGNGSLSEAGTGAPAGPDTPATGAPGTGAAPLIPGATDLGTAPSAPAVAVPGN